MKTTVGVLITLFYFGVAMAQNSDKLLNVYKKDTVKIVLVDNPSTGYSWTMNDAKLPKKLLFLKSNFIPNKDGLIGAAGEREFYFYAKKTGKIDVYFYKRRGNQPPVDTLVYKINIQKKPKGKSSQE